MICEKVVQLSFETLHESVNSLINCSIQYAHILNITVIWVITSHILAHAALSNSTLIIILKVYIQ